jgi:hypothetical protein
VNPADEALAEAWRLGAEDPDDAVESRYEELLPVLIAAGYAEADEYTWNFTPKGVARAEAIAADRS